MSTYDIFPFSTILFFFFQQSCCHMMVDKINFRNKCTQFLVFGGGGGVRNGESWIAKAHHSNLTTWINIKWKCSFQQEIGPRLQRKAWWCFPLFCYSPFYQNLKHAAMSRYFWWSPSLNWWWHFSHHVSKLICYWFSPLPHLDWSVFCSPYSGKLQPEEIMAGAP